MQIAFKLGALAFGGLAIASIHTPVFASQSDQGRIGLVPASQAQPHVSSSGGQIKPQTGPPPSTSVFTNIYACDPDNDHGASASFVNDHGAGLVANLKVNEAEGFNEVQSGVDVVIPPGGVPGTSFTFVWKPLNGTVLGCNQGLYILLRISAPSVDSQFLAVSSLNDNTNTTGPDANGYFPTTYSLANGTLGGIFTASEWALVTTDNGQFNIQSINVNGTNAPFNLHNRKQPHVAGCPLGTNHAAFLQDFYCGI